MLHMMSCAASFLWVAIFLLYLSFIGYNLHIYAAADLDFYNQILQRSASSGSLPEDTMVQKLYAEYRLNSTNTELNNLMGLVSFMQGDLTDAITFFKKACIYDRFQTEGFIRNFFLACYSLPATESTYCANHDGLEGSTESCEVRPEPSSSLVVIETLQIGMSERYTSPHLLVFDTLASLHFQQMIQPPPSISGQASGQQLLLSDLMAVLMRAVEVHGTHYPVWLLFTELHLHSHFAQTLTSLDNVTHVHMSVSALGTSRTTDGYTFDAADPSDSMSSATQKETASLFRGWSLFPQCPLLLYAVALHCYYRMAASAAACNMLNLTTVAIETGAGNNEISHAAVDCRRDLLAAELAQRSLRALSQPYIAADSTPSVGITSVGITAHLAGVQREQASKVPAVAEQAAAEQTRVAQWMRSQQFADRVKSLSDVASSGCSTSNTARTITRTHTDFGSSKEEEGASSTDGAAAANEEFLTLSGFEQFSPMQSQAKKDADLLLYAATAVTAATASRMTAASTFPAFSAQASSPAPTTTTTTTAKAATSGSTGNKFEGSSSPQLLPKLTQLPSLQVGCSQWATCVRAGWLVADALLNVSTHLQTRAHLLGTLPDASVGRLYSAHTLEHLELGEYPLHRTITTRGGDGGGSGGGGSDDDRNSGGGGGGGGGGGDDATTAPATSTSSWFSTHCVAAEVCQALREWHRVLAPGGEIMISVPDIITLATVMSKPTTPHSARMVLLSIIYGGQKDEFDYHKTGYTFELLEELLLGVGFCSVQRVKEFDLLPDDTSSKMYQGEYISLNVKAHRCV